MKKYIVRLQEKQPNSKENNDAYSTTQYNNRTSIANNNFEFIVSMGQLPY